MQSRVWRRPTRRQVALLGVVGCVLAVGGALLWINWGGGPVAWSDPSVRPAMIPDHWERRGPNTWCEPLAQVANPDRECREFVGPWSPDYAEAFGGDPREYERIQSLDCAALLIVRDDQLDADGHLGYMFAAQERMAEIGCL